MFYLNSVQNYKLCVVELLQAREEIIGHFRNITCLSSCVNQVWKRALSIPCSKLECQALWSNLVCWQFCDRKIIWPAQFFCFKIGVIIAPHLMVLLSGSTLDHEYEEVYRTAIWWNQGRCSLGGEVDEVEGCIGLTTFAATLTGTVVGNSSAARSVILSVPHTTVGDLYSCVSAVH